MKRLIPWLMVLGLAAVASCALPLGQTVPTPPPPPQFGPAIGPVLGP